MFIKHSQEIIAAIIDLASKGKTSTEIALELSIQSPSTIRGIVYRQRQKGTVVSPPVVGRVARYYPQTRKINSWTWDGCLYMTGEPADGAPFCAQPKKDHSSYCQHHHALCNTAPPKRKRRERR